MNVDEITINQMTLDEMNVYEMNVDEMTVNKMTCYYTKWYFSPIILKYTACTIKLSAPVMVHTGSHKKLLQ